jgi:excisionase family DNA binding protein
MPNKKARQGTGRVLGSRWDGRDTFTVDETAEILGICRATAYTAVKTGAIPVIQIGARRIVSRFTIESLLTA